MNQFGFFFKPEWKQVYLVYDLKELVREENWYFLCWAENTIRHIDAIMHNQYETFESGAQIWSEQQK